MHLTFFLGWMFEEQFVGCVRNFSLKHSKNVDVMSKTSLCCDAEMTIEVPSRGGRCECGEVK